jgi:hypothetical protein
VTRPWAGHARNFGFIPGRYKRAVSLVQNVETGYRAHLASCLMGPGGKAAGA